jgi:multidrug resistance efflux pump
MSLLNYFGALRGARRSIWLWTSLAVLAGGAWAWFVMGQRLMRPADTSASQTYVTVKEITMDIAIRQAGELQAVKNIDIVCPVQGQNTLQTIVPEGTFVKTGEVIATLDSNLHRQNLDTAELELAKAEADVKWAIEAEKIQESTNVANLDGANSELSLAKIDLLEYTDGEFPADVKDAKRKLEMANLKLKRSEEDLATTKRLVERSFATTSEVQKAELDVITARNDQEKADSDLRVLTEYKHTKDTSEKQDKVAQAEKKLARVINENSANLSQKVSDRTTKQSLLVQRRAARDRAQKMFESCTIKAPSDGMVLYASSTPGYYRDAPIQPGTNVYFQQLIVRLPDVSNMKAVVKIAEARAARLRLLSDQTILGEVSIVGIPRTIGAKLTKIGILPDNADRYINPDAKDYPVDLTLDETPANLKPGASANVTIHVGTLENVLAVPVAAIYSVGNDHWVFTRAQPQPKPVSVSVGEASETMVCLTSGATAGQEVLMLEAGQGRQLLDFAGIKVKDPEPTPSKPTSRPARQLATPEPTPAPGSGPAPTMAQPLPGPVPAAAPSAAPAAPAVIRMAPTG